MLKDLFDKSRQQVFVCIGTMKNGVDSIAPRIGTELEKLGYKVYGTRDNQIHALTIEEKRKEFDDLCKKTYQVIAIDAAILLSGETYTIQNKGCSPGAAVKKDIKIIGESCILINSPILVSDEYLALMTYFTDYKLAQTIDSKIEHKLEQLKEQIVEEILNGIKYNDNKKDFTIEL